MKLKILLVVIVSMFALKTYSQDFKLQTVVGQGIIINSDQDVTLFNTVLSVVPSITIDKFRVSAITQSYINESNTNYFAGSELSYMIAGNPTQLRYNLGVTGLIGTEGKKYLGGSFTVETDDLISVSLTAGNEFKEKEFYGSLNLGLMIAD